MEQHTKTVETKPVSNDTSEKVTKSTTTKLSSYKLETEKKIATDTDNFLGDVLSCLDVIKQHQTKTLTIEITTDQFFQPKLIVKTWTVTKEYYGK